MASERDANAAREKHAKALEAIGAHAVAVDNIEHEGKRTFGVIAYVSTPPSKPPPETLAVTRGGKTVKVPLRVKTQPRFQAE